MKLKNEEVIMSPFCDFEEMNGPAIKCTEALSTTIDLYNDILPSSLIDHWKKKGWGAYANGLLWLVNPQDFDYISTEWLDEDSRSGVVFARTAFGEMFIWVHEKVYYLSAQYGWTKDIADDIEDFFEIALCDERFINKGLEGKVYQEALPKLGIPEYDECYAFVPSLVLGGSGKADTLQKVKLHEHLAFLVQLHK
ncbi:MAG: GAD-like domain-containing protein [Candidatus Dojkabacteria bacterium]